jgi:phenol/toluene 2-monooxygenase (NADH) P0/A0
MHTRPVHRCSPEAPDTDTSTLPPLSCDAWRRFVRVLEERADGLVFFEFSIGWPELAVELLLPRPAFDEFCATNRVQRLEGAPPHPHNEETQA